MTQNKARANPPGGDKSKYFIRETNEVPRRLVIGDDNTPSAHPLARLAGDLAGDPLAPDWLEAMRAYREEAEANPCY